VVRQSSSISRLENMELLASLSSSHPGLLKREREQELEDEEQESTGEPDSKKSNTVEEEEGGDWKSKKREDVHEEEDTAEEAKTSTVVAVSKLSDKAELEASFSSSRSKLKIIEGVKEVVTEMVEEVKDTVNILPPETTSVSPSVPLPSPVQVSPVKVQKRVPEETKQTIGKKELQNERKLQQKRLNKMLTIFEDQSRVKTITIAEEKNEVQEIPNRLQSLDEDM